MKKILTLIAVGSIAFGVVSAAAASLGGLNSGGNLSAATVAVDSCAVGTVSIAYTTEYSAGTDEYALRNIKLTSDTAGGFTGCVGQDASVTINDTEDSVVVDLEIQAAAGNASVTTVATTGDTLTLNVFDVPAESVNNVAVMIQDND